MQDQRTELLDLLGALRGRRPVTAEDIARADAILALVLHCTSCGAALEEDNESESECFACQGAPRL